MSVNQIQDNGVDNHDININVKDIKASSISFIGSGSFLNYYEEYTTPATASGIYGVNVPTTLRFIRIGKVVTLYISTTQGNSNGALTMTFNPGVPLRFKPADTVAEYFVQSIIVVRNNLIENGTLIVAPDTALSIQFNAATLNNSGINCVSATWITS